MGLAVLDLTLDATRLDVVVEAWVGCALVQPLVWGRVTPNSGASSIDWSLISAEQVTSSEPNELFNRLGERSELRIVVVVERAAEGENATGDENARRQAMFRELQRLQTDFAPSAGSTPEQVACTLLLLPSRSDQGWNLDVDHAIVEGWGWSQILVVSPEDSPCGNLGDELGQRPLAAVAAHCLIGVSQHWNLRLHRTELCSSLKQAELVRCWTRVVDAGYVIDHVGQAISQVPLSSTEPASKRLDRAFAELARLTDVARDLSFPEPSVEPRVVPDGLAYIIGFLRFAIPRLFRTITALLARRWIEPVQRLVERMIDVILRWLGRPESERGRTRRDEPFVDPLAVAIAEATHSLELLERGQELDEPPPAAPTLWSSIAKYALEQVDAHQLSAREAVGPSDGAADKDLLKRLRETYSSLAIEARVELQRSIGTAMPATPAGHSETGQPGSPKKSKWRRRAKRMAVFLTVAAAMFVLVGALIPALALLVTATVAVGATAVLSLPMLALAHLAREFADQFRFDGADQSVTRINHWRYQTEKFVYRESQLSTWTRVLRALITGASQGPPLPDHAQGDFQPTISPRAMQFATGLADDEIITQVAQDVRTSHDRPFFTIAWNALLNDHPRVFEDRTRYAWAGTLSALLNIEQRGLPPKVRSLTRDLIWRAVEGKGPDELLSGVVLWERDRDRRGLERVGPPTGFTSLGPVGRGLDGDGPDVDLAFDAFRACQVALVDEDNQIIAIGTRVGSEGALVVTGRTAAEVSPRIQPNLEAKWLPLGEHLVQTMPTDSGTGIALAGIGIVKQGRAVIAGAAPASGEVRGVVATIERVNDNGTFVVDTVAPIGSPVVDQHQHSLLGIVIASRPTIAIGPSDLLQLIASAVSSGAPVDGELDPGLVIPTDVLQQGGAAYTPDAPRHAHHPLACTASSFLEATSLNRSNVFAPLLFKNSLFDDVQAESAVECTYSAQLDGRLLMASHVIQRSVPGSFSLYKRKHRSSDPNDSTDEGDEGSLAGVTL